MQLSERTIEILKNFATINPSIVIQQGQVIRVTSPSKTILSHALVEEDFPNKFGIYDLPRFLGTLSLFTKPDLYFTDHYVAIKSGTQQSKFFYCEPELIMTPPDNEIPVNNVIAEFTLTEHDLAAIMKGANVLQVPELVVESRAGDILVTAKDSKNTAKAKKNFFYGSGEAARERGKKRFFYGSGEAEKARAKKRFFGK